MKDYIENILTNLLVWAFVFGIYYGAIAGVTILVWWIATFFIAVSLITLLLYALLLCILFTILTIASIKYEEYQKR
jgi:hypothetical protein